VRIKQFEAPTVQKAVEKVRAEMGPEAIILSTQKKELPRGNAVIVMAAVDRDLVEQRNRPPIEEKRKISPGEANRTDFLEEGKMDWEMDRTESALLLLKKMVDEALGRRHHGKVGDSPYEWWLERLVESGIEDAIAWALIRKLSSKTGRIETISSLKGKIEGVLERMVKVTGEIFQKGDVPRFVTFLGPPGVGKTTTLAKLAARWKDEVKRPIVLLSTDVYRIGAMDQLHIYGSLMGLPVEAIYSKKDLYRVCSSYPENTIFMVDTTGRSHRDDQGLMEIKILLDPMLDKMWSFLLLDAGRKKEDLLDDVDGFSLFPVRSLIWTKMDETRFPGEVVNVFLHTKIPISYITTGQNVPGDMEVAHPKRLREIILTDKESRRFLWIKRQDFAYPVNA